MKVKFHGKFWLTFLQNDMSWNTLQCAVNIYGCTCYVLTINPNNWLRYVIIINKDRTAYLVSFGSVLRLLNVCWYILLRSCYSLQQKCPIHKTEHDWRQPPEVEMITEMESFEYSKTNRILNAQVLDYSWQLYCRNLFGKYRRWWSRPTMQTSWWVLVYTDL